MKLKSLILIFCLIALSGCGNCNLSKGDEVRHLTTDVIGKVLLIHASGGGSDTCTARIYFEDSEGRKIGYQVGADWDVIE